jgi:hypothetical protein
MAAGKKSGRKSQASNDFLEPLKPTGVTATDVGTARAFNNGAATVSFSLPALSPAATSFTVTSSTGQTATGASSPITVTGITANASVTFTVTATNAAGTSAASTASSAIAITTVPATPNAPTITQQVNQDTISWSAPANGGKAITGYTWASSDGKGATVGSGTTTVAVAQEGGTSQTYTVRAINANGNSLVSPASVNITTTPPFFPPYFVPPFFPPYFVPPFFPPFFPFFPFFPPYFVPPFFPPFFPFFPFFPPYFVPPYFVPPFFPPYFVPPYFVPPFFPPYFVPPYFAPASPLTYCPSLGYNVPSSGYPGNCPGFRLDGNTVAE